MARGKRITVMPTSLMARFTMKNSAGFKMALFRNATSKRREFPKRDTTPGEKTNAEAETRLKIHNQTIMQ